MTVKVQKELIGGILVPFTKKDAPVEEIIPLEWLTLPGFEERLRTLQVRDEHTATYMTPAISNRTAILSRYTRDLQGHEITREGIRSSGAILRDRYFYEDPPLLPRQARK